jgi:hypothetical protein
VVVVRADNVTVISHWNRIAGRFNCVTNTLVTSIQNEQ